MYAGYGFEDASGNGFGRTLTSEQGLKFSYGLWGRDLSHQSSNYREFRNLFNLVELEMADSFPVLTSLVDTVEQFISDALPNWEMFLFTDNSVAEGAYYRCTLLNRALFDLVLRLRRLEMQFSLHLHVIHVSGLRMIAQGTDGLSRGDLDTGVMRGTSMLSFVPLHLSAMERSEGLLVWLHSWLPGLLFCLLHPFEWYSVGHGITGFYSNLDGVLLPVCEIGPSVILLWAPAPAASEAALDN